MLETLETLASVFHNFLPIVIPIVIPLICFAIVSKAFFFVTRVWRTDDSSGTTLRREKAIQEFRELTDSAETDSQIWYDFWERNDEFRDDIMKLKG